uniref:Uncharacterized protein n=1 Tax=Acrobeloides nanus TaxID=290746 RepID=A0A914DC95_9BILA
MHRPVQTCSRHRVSNSRHLECRITCNSRHLEAHLESRTPVQDNSTVTSEQPYRVMYCIRFILFIFSVNFYNKFTLCDYAQLVDINQLNNISHTIYFDKITHGSGRYIKLEEPKTLANISINKNHSFIALELWFQYLPEFEKQNKSVTINFNGFEYGPPFSSKKYSNESCAIKVNLNRISPKVDLLKRFHGSHRSIAEKDATLNVKVIMEGLGQNRLIRSTYTQKTAAEMIFCDPDHEKGRYYDYPNTYMEDIAKNDVYYRLCDAHVSFIIENRKLRFMPQIMDYFEGPFEVPFCLTSLADGDNEFQAEITTRNPNSGINLVFNPDEYFTVKPPF